MYHYANNDQFSYIHEHVILFNRVIKPQTKDAVLKTVFKSCWRTTIKLKGLTGGIFSELIWIDHVYICFDECDALYWMDRSVVLRYLGVIKCLVVEKMYVDSEKNDK